MVESATKGFPQIYPPTNALCAALRIVGKAQRKLWLGPIPRWTRFALISGPLPRIPAIMLLADTRRISGARPVGANVVSIITGPHAFITRLQTLFASRYE